MQGSIQDRSLSVSDAYTVHEDRFSSKCVRASDRFGVHVGPFPGLAQWGGGGVNIICQQDQSSIPTTTRFNLDTSPSIGWDEDGDVDG